jgi:hypothetical protein
MSGKKDTNPKDAVGVLKVGESCIPSGPVMEMGLAMLEGARKYGRHNYRTAGVRGSVYYDAIIRHLKAWWEGQDNDPDSDLHHLVKIMACCAVLRDSMLRKNWIDDRPPKMDDTWLADLNKKAADIIKRYPDAKAPYTQLDLEKA